MNCKPGDLAVIVAGPHTPEMVGHIVRVERLAVDGERLNTAGRLVIRSADEVAWVVTGDRIPLRTLGGHFLTVSRRAVDDRLLRPIRDTDGEDEMLRIAGRPETVEA